MNPHFLRRFPRQLGHWAIHGFFNSLPSFLIAVIFLNLRDLPSILAMLAAVALFVIAFAVVTSLPGPMEDDSHILSRSVRLGAKIRSWIAGISLLLLPVGGLFFIPDFWCGFAAAMIHDAAAGWLGFPNAGLRALNESNETTAQIPAIFATTMLEGLIISLLLLTIAFFCVIFLQIRARRRFLRTAAGAMGVPARVPDGPETLQ